MKKRYYKVWILFLPQSSPKLWHCEEWVKVHNCLKGLVLKTRQRQTMEVHHFENGKTLHKSDLLFNLKNSEKWSHFSKANEGFCQHWDFWKVNIRCPSNTECVNSNIPPDLFFSLNHVNFDRSIKPIVSQFIIFAVASDLEEDATSLIPGILNNLIKISKSFFVAELTSRWVTRKTELEVSTIDSSYTRHFFKSGWNGSKVPDLSDFDTENATFEIVKGWIPST